MLSIHQIYRFESNSQLESENAGIGEKTPDGKLNGMIMDIKAVEGAGKWTVKSKFHEATVQGAECVVLYFHDKSLYSLDRISDGWKKFLEDIDSDRYKRSIKKVLCIVERKLIEWPGAK